MCTLNHGMFLQERVFVAGEIREARRFARDLSAAMDSALTRFYSSPEKDYVIRRNGIADAMVDAMRADLRWWRERLAATNAPMPQDTEIHEEEFTEAENAVLSALRDNAWPAIGASATSDIAPLLKTKFDERAVVTAIDRLEKTGEIYSQRCGECVYYSSVSLQW